MLAATATSVNSCKISCCISWLMKVSRAISGGNGLQFVLIQVLEKLRGALGAENDEQGGQLLQLGHGSICRSGGGGFHIWVRI